MRMLPGMTTMEEVDIVVTTMHEEGDFIINMYLLAAAQEVSVDVVEILRMPAASCHLPSW